MPGPASGGGGFRGGGGGGSFGGGGFRGGHHHHHHGYYGRPYGFFGFYRPYGYYGGGCLGGFLGMLIAPIIMLLLVAIFLSVIVGGAISNVASGGNVNYSESEFQEYAYNKYFEHFDSRKSTFEDNVLVVVLVNEDSDHGYYIAMTGDNLSTAAKSLFRTEEYYALGKAFVNNMQEYYEYSFSSDMAAIISDMTVAVSPVAKSGGLYNYPSYVENPETCELINDSNLSINENTVNMALADFYAETGLAMKILVEDAEDVFGKTIDVGSIITVIILLVIAGVAIYLIVRAVKAKNDPNNKNGNGQNGNGNNNGYGGNNNSGYNNGNYNNNYNNNGNYNNNNYGNGYDNSDYNNRGYYN